MVTEVVSPLNWEAHRNGSITSRMLVGSKQETQKNDKQPSCLLAPSYELWQSPMSLHS